MTERYDEGVLLDYVEGDLDAAEAKRVHEWVRSDPRLRRLMEKLIDDRNAIRSLTDPPSPVRRVGNVRWRRERGGDVDPVSDNELDPTLRRVAWGALTVTLITSIALGWWWMERGQPSIPEPEANNQAPAPDTAPTPSPTPPPTTDSPFTTDPMRSLTWDINLEEILSGKWLQPFLPAIPEAQPITPSPAPALPPSIVAGDLVEIEEEWTALIRNLSTNPSYATQCRIELVTTTSRFDPIRAGLERGYGGWLLRADPHQLRSKLRALEQPGILRVRFFTQVHTPHDPAEPDYEHVLRVSLADSPVPPQSVPIKIRVVWITP